MKKEWFWKVDGVVMPSPKAPVQITEIDLDAASTGRPESGVLHRERVRHDVMQISMDFPKLSAEEAHMIRTAIAPTQVAVTFLLFGEPETRMMYAGDRKWVEWFDDSGGAHVSLSLNMSEY